MVLLAHLFYWNFKLPTIHAPSIQLVSLVLMCTLNQSCFEWLFCHTALSSLTLWTTHNSHIINAEGKFISIVLSYTIMWWMTGSMFSYTMWCFILSCIEWFFCLAALLLLNLWITCNSPFFNTAGKLNSSVLSQTVLCWLILLSHCTSFSESMNHPKFTHHQYSQ